MRSRSEVRHVHAEPGDTLGAGSRRTFLYGAVGACALAFVPFRAGANVLRAGNDVSLKCLGTTNGPRYLDGRTGNGSVGLAPALTPAFSGTKWHVAAGGGLVLLQCRGTVEGPRWLDGRTADGTVGLAPATKMPYSGTRWKVVQLDPDTPDVVALQCMGRLAGPRYLDGRTGDGSVGLAPSTDAPFSGTRWEVRSYPVAIDEGTQGNPASN